MPSRIDHVIVAARDLSALEAAFTRLGFFVTGGGTHPHLGTRNRIIILEEGYIELLGIADLAKVSPVLTRRLATAAAGWVGFALQSDDIVAESEAMRARGVDVRGPQPGRLVAPGGMSRSWRVTTIGSDDLWAAAQPLPFLIQHDATGEQHRTELAGEGGLTSHANGAQRLGAVYLTVRNLEASAAAYARAYGLRPSGDMSRHDEYLVAETQDLPLAALGERLVLTRPTANGPAQARLDGTGEGVCAVSVVVGSRSATEDMLRSRGIGCTVSGGNIWVDERDMLGVSVAFTPYP